MTTPSRHRAAAPESAIETMQSECQRLSELLDHFLDFAKVQRANLKPTDLNAEIESILEFFSAEMRLTSIDVVRYLDPELPRVLLDREQFRGALVNLILNAKQAMPDGGQLVVRTVAQGERVVIHLIDTGCGMNDRTASKMFEAFYSTKPGGSGLGLPTTQKIIAAHGGRISVQSEMGHGTQFVIDLPVPQRIETEKGGEQ